MKWEKTKIRKVLERAILGSVVLLLALTGVTLAADIDYHSRYQNAVQAVKIAQEELRMVEVEWCKEKLANPDEWDEATLVGCAKKVKGFQ